MRPASRSREEKCAEHDDGESRDLGDGCRPLDLRSEADAAGIDGAEQDDDGDGHQLLNSKPPVNDRAEQMEIVSRPEGAEWHERAKERSERGGDGGKTSAGDEHHRRPTKQKGGKISICFS